MKASKSKRAVVNVGIDVSKDKLDVCFGVEEKMQRYENSLQGCKQLTEELAKHSVERIAVEPTGGYERSIFFELANLKLPVVLVNPRRVREFARAMGQKAKTDELDARVLALYAERIRPEVMLPTETENQELAALLSRREQLVRMRVAELNRRRRHPKGKVKQSIDAVIAMLSKQIKELESEMDAWMDGHPMFQEREQRLRSTTGVGPIVSRTLIAKLAELGKSNHKEIAALAGLAPYARDSGKYCGKRHISGGRGEVRRMMLQAAHVSVLYEPSMRAFYQRLLKAGKPKQVAITAAARKLLVRLNAMMHSETDYNPPLPT